MHFNAIAAPLLLAAAATAVPQCLTPSEVAQLSRSFYLQADPFKRYILTGEGPIPARQAGDSSTDHWFISGDDFPNALRTLGYPDAFVGTPENGWRLMFAGGDEGTTERVRCCVRGLDRPILCSAKGDGSTYGSKFWVNRDGSVSLGPEEARPKRARMVKFIVRENLPGQRSDRMG